LLLTAADYLETDACFQGRFQKNTGARFEARAGGVFKKGIL